MTVAESEKNVYRDWNPTRLYAAFVNLYTMRDDARHADNISKMLDAIRGMPENHKLGLYTWMEEEELVFAEMEDYESAATFKKMKAYFYREVWLRE